MKLLGSCQFDLWVLLSESARSLHSDELIVYGNARSGDCYRAHCFCARHQVFAAIAAGHSA
jgi:hypothetical protein